MRECLNILSVSLEEIAKPDLISRLEGGEEPFVWICEEGESLAGMCSSLWWDLVLSGYSGRFLDDLAL